ncbi:hypothetical protein [uncultured Flavobacterium sp.]|uniref:hypothetical protein n=1 Tax=uncultured Flavobacterium sp. TaxID=165435 RepID=UPI0025CFC7CA|nr:hypothetical protein [uncultured Flavobacterium sp.]
MTRYEAITGMGGDFTKLISLGLIPIHIADWKVYYEAYRNELDSAMQQGRKREKCIVADIVADQYDITRRTVYNIIAFMEGK